MMRDIKPLLILIFLFKSFNGVAQSDTMRTNIQLIDSIENVYKKDCTNIRINNYRKKKIKRDKRLIEVLNRYSVDSSFKKYIESEGFTQRNLNRRDTLTEIKQDTYYKHSGGYIRGFVIFYYKNGIISSVKMQIATDTKFFCSTEKSYNISYIDALYIKKHLLQLINFPLKVSPSNVELETL